MPRTRRYVRPGRLIHVITRFLNHEYLLDSPEARAEYLRRAEISFAESDWTWLGHALMGTHVHEAALSGVTPYGDISRRLHSGFAGWINPRKGRLGPIVAGRPDTYEVEPAGAMALIAYVHNNPVRAGVVAHPADSDWTSHRSYLAGQSSRLVDVDTGLKLCGLTNSVRGRRLFAEEVIRRSGQSRAFVDDNYGVVRTDVREQVGPVVELSHPIMSADGVPLKYPLWQLQPGTIPTRWRGEVATAIVFICDCLQVDRNEVLSTSRRRALVRVRRLVVLACCAILGCRLNQVAAALGITPAAARKLQISAKEPDIALARELADKLCA